MVFGRGCNVCEWSMLQKQGRGLVFSEQNRANEHGSWPNRAVAVGRTECGRRIVDVDLFGSSRFMGRVWPAWDCCKYHAFAMRLCCMLSC
jgi:hypothetical protein